MLEQTVQRGCGCPIPGGVQGQVGWGPGQPGLVTGEVGGPARQGGWRFMILEVSSNPFCDSVICEGVSVLMLNAAQLNGSINIQHFIHKFNLSLIHCAISESRRAL